ncbi:biotin synthase BioB [Christensenella tenuis]|uniref:Biotin synthase n=1 Tax=Christensenella tenuis TaxID=2763033 RepID=A0ABR7EI76_9FIRM|nr:biotin synthase BioB [Christensenella tenuis]MBC5649480.1 biotin synthase BioB [Christensenella tenuis]
MNIRQLQEKAVRGGLLSKGEALFLSKCELEELRRAADEIRRTACGNRFDLCSIINGKSGRCPEDCKFCAQSIHYKTKTEFYELLDAKEILTAARKNCAGGVNRFSIVTSGKRLTDAEIEQLCGIYRKIKEECGLSLCASHGLLTQKQFEMLRQAGVSRYHNNLETSRDYFPKICTTHSYDDKISTIRTAQNAGLTVCSGGIIGMGESMEDRIEMALTLRELGIRSVPLNILNPVEGTPLDGNPVLSGKEAERTAAVFRFLLPEAQIRLAGGRIHLRDRGRRMLRSGVNAAITGDMLTTAGITKESDSQMIRECGFEAGV